MKKVQCLVDPDNTDQVTINGPYYNLDNVDLKGMIKITAPLPKGRQVIRCSLSPSVDNDTSSC